MINEPIEWDELYSVGHQHIDSQHRQLLELVRGLQGLDAEPDGVDLHRAVMEISRHVYSHFVDEESWMEEIDYPDIRQHANEHRKLSRILASYRRDAEDGRIDSYQFIQFISGYILNHMLGEDKKFGDYLLSHGG